MRSLVLLCLLVCPAIAPAASDEVVIQGNLYPLNIVPTFDHGYLATYEKDGLSVYAPDGSLAMRIASPSRANIVNADIDSDGSVAAAVRGYLPIAGSILFFSPDGSTDGRIVTGPYVPSQVCFAPDHSIWILGSEERRTIDEIPSYSLLRHYSRAGELLGQFLPRSSFPADVEPGQTRVGLWGLRIANGRIGVILHDAGENRYDLWLEADLNGKEIGRWSASSTAQSPRAVTESGAVYAEGKGLSMLDWASGSWKPVSNASNDLLGADGNSLVFIVPGMNRIQRVAVP